MKKVFNHFGKGILITIKSTEKFDHLPWNPHPVFEGVEIKHLITAKESQGEFSYHLVKIAPDKKIGSHNHQGQIETHEVIAGSGTCILAEKSHQYQPGTITIFPKNEIHEIVAEEEGLFIFAKFFAALC